MFIVFKGYEYLLFSACLNIFRILIRSNSLDFFRIDYNIYLNNTCNVSLGNDYLQCSY